MTLFEIDEQITALIDENGEIADYETFEALTMERDKKLENTALYIKNLRAESTALGEQRKIFAEREKAAKDKADRLEAFLERALAGQKFSTAQVAVTFRKSVKTVVDDITALPEVFLRWDDPKPDLAAIKEALNNGTEIAGAHLEEKQNISIK